MSAESNRPLNQCLDCSHNWYPRTSRISLQCPSCRSRNVQIRLEPGENESTAPNQIQTSRQPGITWSTLFDPSGRSSRKQFAPIIIPHVLIGATLSVLSEDYGGLAFVVALLYWLPGLYIGMVAVIRRFHDLARSGWWSLLMLVPLVNFGTLVYLLFAESRALGDLRGE